MKRAKTRLSPRIIGSWRQGRALLERWRRDTANVSVELKRPRAIDVVPIDFLRGEPARREARTRLKFRGRLIYHTGADVTIRRPSGAILVIDIYEIAALSDGKMRLEPL